MLLIRPLLQTNRERTRVTHTVVFFIFLVSNIGGMLTPLGDPPLFLGYLQGVPFAWTLRLWGPWLTDDRGAARCLYYVWDSRQHARETNARAPARSHPDRAAPDAAARSTGPGSRAWWLAVAFLHAPVARARHPGPGRRLPVAHAADDPPRRTSFTAGPIVEVAVLFAGDLPHDDPRARAAARCAAGSSACGQPWQFFWATGVLSSFLDNAPTYLTFLALAQSLRAARRGGRACRHVILAAHQRGRGRDGGQHLHRQRPELHGQGHRGSGGRAHAELLRLHGLQRRGAAAALRARDRRCSSRRAAAPAARSGAGRSAGSCPRSSWDPCRRAWPPP